MPVAKIKKTCVTACSPNIDPRFKGKRPIQIQIVRHGYILVRTVEIKRVRTAAALSNLRRVVHRRNRCCGSRCFGAVRAGIAVN